ncbi:MAG: hypothetical protein A2017_05950 [Lentisphaerae bacterium GWF2_44_16]|nr:MAG: hypothetical protein A2017_05950 [Lentisphaerae bacterium GWF2_44_16]
MILPDKHNKLSNSLLGVGAVILENMSEARTVSSLWNKVKVTPEVSTFERFTLSLDLLFMIGVIEFDEGFLRRTINDIRNKR